MENATQEKAMKPICTTIAALMGKTLTAVTRGDDELLFDCADGSKFKMWHHSDCCETVVIEDICGDLTDLVGSPIVRAEERETQDTPPGCWPHDESNTWTFYELATVKGSVTIRWHGSSNGYYSESVNFDQVTP